MVESAKLAFVFPGQGSQQVGMLASFAHRPEIGRTFNRASEVLGFDLWRLVQEGPQEQLELTEYTQPALLACSVAVWRIWHSEGGVQPTRLIGHSLGEWSALVCAGVVAFEDAVSLVRLRGQYMQEAVPVGQGSMAAIIGLSDDVVAEMCQEASGGRVVMPANFNAPGQVVIAGESGAVDRAIALCKEVGAKRALPLAVSAPFHTSLMKPAAERLAERVAAVFFAAPSIPVIHNVHAKAEADPLKVKERVIEQISSPVRWVECITACMAEGVDTFVECGSGKVLSGLNKRIDKSLTVLATDNEETLAETLAKTRGIGG